MGDTPHFSVKQYISAFGSYASKISDEQLAMLKAHAEAPGQKLSTLQLARAAGSKTPQRTHAAYGRLGHALARILDPRTRRLSGSDKIWTRYLGEDKRDPKTNVVVWKLNSEVTKALNHLGWASPPKRNRGRIDTSDAIPQSFLFVTCADRNPEKVRDKPDSEWSCGKFVRPGNPVFVYVTEKGICHEWVITVPPTPDPKWGYSCPVRFVADFEPPISIHELREWIPHEVWPPPHFNFRGYRCIGVPVAAATIIRRLRARSKGSTHSTVTPVILLSQVEQQFEKDLLRAEARSVAERRARLRRAKRYPEKTSVTTVAFARNADVITEVLRRAGGRCENCHRPAPFARASDGSPYLEVHHRIRLAEGGEDTIKNAVALCPNCHRRSHFG